MSLNRIIYVLAFYKFYNGVEIVSIFDRSPPSFSLPDALLPFRF